MKKFYQTIFIICFILVLSNTCFAAYHEVNFDDTELNIEYQEYNFKEQGNVGELKDALSELDQETDQNNGFPINNFLNYKRYQFWILIIALATILIILFRLSKRLKKIEKEYAKKRIQIISKQNQITEKDEILYGAEESKTIKPTFVKDKKQKLNIKKENIKNINISTEQDEQDLKNENENIKIIVEDETQEKPILIDVEDTDDDYIFEEDNE